MNDRCSECGVVVGRKHLPDCRANKPMNAEQGDVEALASRLSLEPTPRDLEDAVNTLLAFAVKDERDRAEKAERALGLDEDGRTVVTDRQLLAQERIYAIAPDAIALLADMGDLLHRHRRANRMLDMRLTDELLARLAALCGDER